MSLEVWCSLSQCRASSGASAAAAEPAPAQERDLIEKTYVHTHHINTPQNRLDKQGRQGGMAS